MKYNQKNKFGGMKIPKGNPQNGGKSNTLKPYNKRHKPSTGKGFDLNGGIK